MRTGNVTQFRRVALAYDKNRCLIVFKSPVAWRIYQVTASHNWKDGNPSWCKEWARGTTSDSVVDRDVEVWRLLTHAR